jgi:hypothetical protein
MADRKRRCKRGNDDGSDTEVASDASDAMYWQADDFLAEVALELIEASKVKMAEHLTDVPNEPGTTRDLAKRVHDGLIENWNGPQSEDGELSAELRRKGSLWAEAKILKLRAVSDG